MDEVTGSSPVWSTDILPDTMRRQVRLGRVGHDPKFESDMVHYEAEENNSC